MKIMGKIFVGVGGVLYVCAFLTTFQTPFWWIPALAFSGGALVLAGLWLCRRGEEPKLSVWV